MSGSSVDGDDLPDLEDSGDESVDGDRGESPKAQPRRRGPAAPQPKPVVQPRTRFSSVGQPMLFFIMAGAAGFWAEDFNVMDVFEFADAAFGDGQNYILGAVLGHWEFTEGKTASASSDEAIYIDMCKLHNKGKHGLLVYKGLRSFKLDNPLPFEFPTTPFKLLQQFGQALCKVCVGNQQFSGSSNTVKAQVRQWKDIYKSSSMQMQVVRMCPKAAFMVISGWDVWHAVPVSKKHRGTTIIGRLT